MNAVDEIRHLYHHTTKATIQRDLMRAVALLKTLATEEEREAAAVYMDGLSQMRSEWGVRPPATTNTGGATGNRKKTARAAGARQAAAVPRKR